MYHCLCDQIFVVHVTFASLSYVRYVHTTTVAISTPGAFVYFYFPMEIWDDADDVRRTHLLHLLRLASEESKDDDFS